MTEEAKQEEQAQSAQETQQQEQPKQSDDSKDVYEEFSDTKKQKLEEDLERAKEKGVSLEEFEKVRKAAAEYSHEAQKYRQEAKAYKELGVEPERVKELLQASRDAEMRQLEEDRKYDEVIKKIREETEQEKESYRNQLTEMQQRVQKTVYEKDLASALSAEDGIKDLLEGKLRSQTKVIEDGDNYRTVVLDEDGTVTDKTVNQLLQEWKNDPVLGHGFKAPKVSGAGTSSESSSKASNAGRPPKKTISEMSMQEKIDYRNKYGREAYNKLPIR